MDEEKKVEAAALLRQLLAVVREVQGRVEALEEKSATLTDIVTQQQHHIDALISDLRTIEEQLDTLARFNNARIPGTFWMWFSRWAGLN